MIALLAAHIATAFAAAWAASRLRYRRPSPREGALELATALLLPGVGAPVVLLGLLLDLRFARTVRPADPRELHEEDDPPAGPADPFRDLRSALTVRPFEDVLRCPDAKTLELALQRLATSPAPDALERLKEAAASPRADLRVRVRAILVRQESRLMQALRSAADPLLRARARRKLAILAPDPVLARQHGERAVRDYRKALEGRADPALRLELARFLSLLGDARGARDVLDEALRRRPSDADALLERVEASVRLGDRDEVRRDAERLRRLGGRAAAAGRRLLA